MKTTVCVAALLFTVSCAAFSPSSSVPSPGSLAPSTAVGSRGSVYFVSPTRAWEFTEPPDHLRTVVLLTNDGGAHWRLWGIAPDAGIPVGVTATEVVLSYATTLLRSSDGAHWSVTQMPGDPATIDFLPDLQHGWVYGFMPQAPLTQASSTPPPGKGGAGGATGKGGASTAPTAPCQEKGCVPTGIWSTTDGGASWTLLRQSTFGAGLGSMSFWTPTTGMIGMGLTLLLTHDAGATWQNVSLPIENVGSDASVQDFGPTMFDAKNGVLEISLAPRVFLSRTLDGGLSWSPPKAIGDCTGCTGQLVFLDDQHWLDYSNGVSLTADGGQTWRKVATSNPAKGASAAELVRSQPASVFVISPGVFASETTDWGTHWRAVALPDIYPTYSGFEGVGGWISQGSPAGCCV